MQPTACARRTLRLLVILAAVAVASGAGIAAVTRAGLADGGHAQRPAQAHSQLAAQESLCANPYLPVSPGATWQRSGSAAGQGFTQVSTVSAVRPDGFDVDMTVTLADGRSQTWRQDWSCTPEGLAQAASPADFLSLFLQGDNQPLTVTTLAIAGVTFPVDIQPGDAWSQVTSFRATGSATSVQTLTGTRRLDFQAAAWDEITVPAGTFTALRVSVTTTLSFGGESAVSVQDQWIAPGVGPVKAVDAESGRVISELESYALP